MKYKYIVGEHEQSTMIWMYESIIMKPTYCMLIKNNWISQT